MNPEIPLRIAAVLAGFMLKTTLAFAICWAWSVLVVSPGSKFLAWLGFLTGVGAYWLWLAKAFFLTGPLSGLAGAGMLPLSPSAAAAWQIPSSWALPLSAALRGAGILYVLALSYFLLSQIRKQLHLRWVLRFAYAPPAEIAEVFQSIADSSCFGRSRLLMLSGIPSPATFGWIRPIILLPPLCLEQDRGELKDILRHELQHLRRWDFVANAFAATCRALVCFHPVAWWAMRKMQLQRELACDLAVVSDSPEKRAKYAECLVRFARLHGSADPKPWGMDFAASSAHLKTRVHSVLAGSKKSSRWLARLRVGCGLLLFAGFLGIAPSLGILFSYLPQQIAQPWTVAVRATGSGVTGARTARRGRPPANRTAIDEDPRIAGNDQPEAIQFVPRARDSSIDREVERSAPTLGGSDGALSSESGAPSNPTASSWPPMRPRSSATRMPSVTSIITGTAAEIAKMPDHDHDKDCR